MNGVFYIGATGLNAQQTAVDVTANNIANMNTPAFKRGTVSFAELVSPVGNDPGTAATVGAARAGSAAAGVSADPGLHVFTAGELHTTSNPLDLAVKGDGFIELGVDATSAELVLWRGGTLHVGSDGFLAAPNGQPLRPMISVPREATSISIDTDGKVLAVVPDQSAPIEIGQIELVIPSDMRSLQSLGGGIYQIRDDGSAISRVKPGEDNAGTLAQGFSEASNVSLSDELVNLMVYQRAYAANARLVQAGDELMSIANGLKR